MVRSTLLNAVLATFALVAIGASAQEGVPLAESITLLAQALDDDGQPLQFINSVVGDDDDDDYTAQQLEQRSEMRRSKHHHKHSRKTKSKTTSSRRLFTLGAADEDELWCPDVQITWYASQDLKNPQCGNGRGSWQPVNSCHIGAVVKHWDDGPQCGEFVKLCNKKADDHCVIVRVIDKCAGCDKDHVDLTKSAFKKLSPSGTLTEGRIKGLKMYRTKTPNPWDLALFGPKLLSA